MALFKTQLHKISYSKVSGKSWRRNQTTLYTDCHTKSIKIGQKPLQNIKPTLTYLHEKTTHQAKKFQKLSGGSEFLVKKRCCCCMPSGGHGTGDGDTGTKQILGFVRGSGSTRTALRVFGKWQVWPAEGLSPLGAQSVCSQELDSLNPNKPTTHVILIHQNRLFFFFSPFKTNFICISNRRLSKTLTWRCSNVHTYK